MCGMRGFFENRGLILEWPDNIVLLDGRHIVTDFEMTE